jgi:hypothetical protein
MRRKDGMPRGSKGERHPLNNLSELRGEVCELYWQVREGKVSPGVGQVCRGLLELMAKLLTESEAEIKAREIEGKMAELAKLLHENGSDVPAWALAPAKRDLPN